MIVVTPCFNRPEYLQVWSDVIQKADRAEEMLYVFCLDYGYDRKYDEIIEAFPFNHAEIRMSKSLLTLGKQSRNVLNGMIAAARQAKELVFYVEEDIFVAKDFFRWHIEVHRQQPNIFCSIGTKNNNSKYRVDGMPGHYYLSSQDRCDYQSLGSCFKPEVILKLIAPHFNESYLKYPVEYCKSNFPKSQIGSIWVEQDGLIRRIMEQNRAQSAFPCLPRAFHAGFYGYNRQPEILKMNYAQRLDMVRRVCFDDELMRQYAVNEMYYLDSVPCELDTDFDELRMVEIELIK